MFGSTNTAQEYIDKSIKFYDEYFKDPSILKYINDYIKAVNEDNKKEIVQVVEAYKKEQYGEQEKYGRFCIPLEELVSLSQNEKISIEDKIKFTIEYNACEKSKLFYYKSKLSRTIELIDEEITKEKRQLKLTPEEKSQLEEQKKAINKQIEQLQLSLEIDKIDRENNSLQKLLDDENEECDLYEISDIPEDLTQYEHSYLLIGEKLYYIKSKREKEEVRIIDFEKFSNDLNGIETIEDFKTIDDIKTNKRDVIEGRKRQLSHQQHEELITLNGGHKKNKPIQTFKQNMEKIKVIDDLSKTNNTIEQKSYDLYKKRLTNKLLMNQDGIKLDSVSVAQPQSLSDTKLSLTQTDDSQVNRWKFLHEQRKAKKSPKTAISVTTSQQDQNRANQSIQQAEQNQQEQEEQQELQAHARQVHSQDLD